MPLYEYHCEACGANIELLVRNSEAKPVCSECESPKLTKLLSVPAGHVAGGASSLPMMPAGGCGKPQCGTGLGGACRR